MKRLRISHPTGTLRGRLELPGSKSESNRLLILRELYQANAEIKGLSNSEDTLVLSQALASYKDEAQLNVGDAGTAMRFMCAFLASRDGIWELDGSARMRERPIQVLVESLKQLGAKIDYLDQEGYPPLRIEGKAMEGGLIRINAGVSSQYLSALMLIAPSLERGLELKLEGPPVSMPYLQLTANLMRRLGFPVFILGDEIRIPNHAISPERGAWRVEPDWSAASYWFAMASFAKEAEIYLPGFQEHSFQGDSIIQQLLAPLGVDQVFLGGGIRVLKAEAFPHPKIINLVHNPDLAQSLVPAYAAFGRELMVKGLQTLRIKETDRIDALAQELLKFGLSLEVGADSLSLPGEEIKFSEQEIATYGDHRMAMGLAPLALKCPLVVQNPDVVAKSYPQFWEHCALLGFDLEWLD